MEETREDSMAFFNSTMQSPYLQYEVGYQACKYKNATWGDILEQDYEHFKELLSLHVPVD